MVDPKKLVAIYEEALGKKSPMDALEYALLCVYDYGYDSAFRRYRDTPTFIDEHNGEDG